MSTAAADRDAIGQLKAKYCRFIDTKRWPELRALFVEDARFEGLGSAPSGADLDTFITGISTRFRDATSVHHCHMPEIRVTGPDTARAVWAMTDYAQWPEGFAVAEVPGHPGFHGYGHYEEEYRRQGGVWRISLLRLTRLRFDALPIGHAPPRPGRLQASTNWIDGEPTWN
jgi:hypothetical protein